MAPQPLPPGKRTRRRKRRLNKLCPSCCASEAPLTSSDDGNVLTDPPGWEPQREKELYLSTESRSDLGFNSLREYYMKLTTIILSVVSCVLAAALIAVHYSKGSQLKATRAAYNTISNQWDDARLKLEESGKLAEVLQGKMAAQGTVLDSVSNDLAKAQSELAAANSAVANAKAEAANRETRMAELDKRIAQLEAERDDVSKKMEDLNASIGTLETRIAETKKKLEMAEGDRTYLLAELKRMQEEKSDLVAQFNNLAALRTQIAKLKEEAAIKQRMEWIRTGIYARQGQKGAERLFARSQETKTEPNNRLEIELERTGGSRVVVPSSSGSSTSAQ
jgi:septal ring factor EnvC (AmiA/AmiB activator)